MRILLDANISWRLIAPLVKQVAIVEHVDSLSLRQPAKDADIWEYAKLNGAIIVANDDDFSLLSVAYGFPPKVVLLKTGNQLKQYI